MSDEPWQFAVLVVIGIVSGGFNAVAGGGSLIAFPGLVALGLPPLTANITNTVGQMPGYVSIAHGYRKHLVGQRGRILALAGPVAVGAGLGVALLKLGGDETFEAIVPWLVLFSCAVLGAAPHIRRRLEERQPRPDRVHPSVALAAGACGAYAAYFGGAAGVVMLAVLALGLSDTLQRLNGVNRVLILIANAVALPVFVLLGPVDWPAVGRPRAVNADRRMGGGAARARSR